MVNNEVDMDKFENNGNDKFKCTKLDFILVFFIMIGLMIFSCSN